MWKPRKLKKFGTDKIRMRFKRIRNESGIVLVTIIVLTVAMAILAVGIMSLNVNQALTNERQVERIRAEELAKGAAWYNFVNLRTFGPNSPGIPSPATITVEGKEYRISRSNPFGGGPNGTRRHQIRVQWDPL